MRRGVALVDLASRQHRKLLQLTGAWAELAARIRPKDGNGRVSKRLKRGQSWLGALAPLVAFCERHEIEPDAVSDETIKAFHADLVRRGAADPLETARKFVYAWEALQLIPDPTLLGMVSNHDRWQAQLSVVAGPRFEVRQEKLMISSG